MHFSSTAVAAATLVAVARAEIDFDLDNAPPDCRTICEPVDQLRDTCAVDLSGDNQDWGEDQLAAQCFCSNGSFEVALVSALCYDCIRQAIDSARDSARFKFKRQAVDGSDCRTDANCRSGSCVDVESDGRSVKVCQSTDGGGGGGGGGDDSGGNDGNNGNEDVNDGNGQDGGNNGNNGNDGNDGNDGGATGAIDGSDCQTDDQCRSGFCADEPGRPNRTCQDPNAPPPPEVPPVEAPPVVTPPPLVTPPADDGIPDGAIDGSDCQTDDQCRSGFCAEEAGRPNKVCQDPNAPPEAPPAETTSPVTTSPPTTTSPPATTSPVETPPAEDDGAEGAIDGSDCQTDDQCRSGFCVEEEGRPNKVCQAPPEDDGGDEPNLPNWEDALNRMSNIVQSCDFQTASYGPNATLLVQDITVSAEPATATDQLTSTFATLAPGPTPTGGNGENNSENGGDGSGDENAGDGNADNSDEETESAAGILSPSFFASAIIVGVMALI